MADFEEDAARKIKPIRKDAVLVAGDEIDIKKNGNSLPGFPKTVPAGKELEVTLKVTGEIRPAP